jgi:hypothetical protein
MANPPTDLNIHIGHEQILQSFDVPVKNHLPSATICPLCKRESLYVYVSPIEGGRWYTCRCCGFAGDSIELYAAGHGLNDLHAAVVELSKQQILPITCSELTRDCVAKYVSYYIERRKRYQAFFEKAKAQVLSINQHWLELFQDHQLWIGKSVPSEWGSTLGMFVGCASRPDVSKLGINLPKNLSHFFVCPYYDVPGRIVSFLLIGARTKQRIKLWNQAEDGLMMLDSTGLEDDIVIAVRDPLFALQLQRKNFICDGKPLKLVVYDHATDRSWMSIYARRVIFWDHSLNFVMFQQAKKHARAYVAQRPQFYDAYEYLRHTTIPKVLNLMTESAVPWPEALKQYILTHDDKGEIYDTIRGLDLTAYDMNRVYELCTTVERELVKQVIGEKPIEQSVYINKQRVVEADGAWWIIRDGHRELLCNAIIRITRAIHAQDSGINQYEGTISANGKTIRFQEQIEVVERNPREWLQRTMMAGGLGVPTMQRIMGRHIIEISKQFCPPVYAQGYSRIGWYPDQQAFIFPNFSIHDGKLDDTLYAMGSKLPAANLLAEPLSRGDWDAALVDSPENATLWAGLTCFMSNLIAPVIGSVPSPVAFVGGVGSIASLIGRHMAKELDMPVFQHQRFIKKQPVYVLQDVQKENRLHGYPIWVDFDIQAGHILSKLNATTRANLMTQIAQPQMVTLAVGDCWIFINSPGVLSQRKGLPKLRGIMRFVAWLQARGFQLEIASNIQLSMLAALTNWADEELHALDMSVLDHAAKLIKTPDMGSLDRKLMQLIFWVREDQKLRIDHDDVYSDFRRRGAGALRSQRVLAVVDDTHGKVFVHELALVRALKTYPEPDLETAVKELAVNSARNGFESGSNGFILSLDYWNSEAKRWSSTRS